MTLKNILVWYLPQAFLFFWGVWFAANTDPPIAGYGGVGLGLMLAAAYTGAANLVINLFAWLSRRAGLGGHSGNPAGDSLRLTGSGRRLTKATEHRDRIRIGK